jgi:DNA-binding HxlR family transcriptional regulator
MPNKQSIDRRVLDLGTVRRASLTVELLFHGKWKFTILAAICSGPIRLGQLARLIPGASKKMLTQNLRQMEADGIVVRTDLSEIVLHVEYKLHPDLEGSISSLLEQLVAWGNEYLRLSTNESSAQEQ